MMNALDAGSIGRAKGWLVDMKDRLGRKKQINGTADVMETQLNRCLSTLDITLMGIGHMVGSGVYVLTSSVTKNIAGPAIVISFVISGFASLLAALCYSEFSVRFPRAGSAYSYTYLALGEFWAFVVGWNMVLENVIGTAAVSRACSAYMDSLLDGALRNYTIGAVSASIGLNALSQHVDLFATLIVICFMVFLTTGVRVTSYLNNLFSIINIGVICMIIVVGSFYADINNWTHVKDGFMPYGWKGVFAASASCFYAYIGFDSIATSGEEARDPQKSIPIATFISMAFATLAYVGVSAVLTLMVPYNQITDESGLPDALGSHGLAWAKLVVIVGAVCGMVTVLIGTLYSLTRIVYAMADDGLLFAWMSRVNDKTQIPLLAMYFFASMGAAMALVLDITTLVEMMSIGTLMAYLVVSASVIIMRYKHVEPMHRVLSADFHNQAELNDLSAESPTNNEDASSAATGSQAGGMDSGFGIGGDGTGTKGAGAGYSAYANYYYYFTSKLKPLSLQTKLRQNAPENLVTILVFVMTAAIFLLCSVGPSLIQSKSTFLANTILAILTLIVAGSFAVIALHEQNASNLRYKVPCVPFIPTLSIVFNVALMANLQWLTWMRLIVWMTAGFIIYFTYGLYHSRLNSAGDTLATTVLVKDGKNGRNWGSLDSANLPDNESVSSAY